MIIYNTTFHVDDDILEDFVTYIKQIFIITAAQSGFLHQPRLARIYAQHEESGTSYSLQFKVKNVDMLNHWFATEGQTLQQDLTARFGKKAHGFTTLLEEIEL